MELGLQHKVAIVTGGTRGIGYSICQELLLEDVIVCGICRDNISKFEMLKKWMTENSIPESNFMPLCLDITDAKELESGVAEIFEKFRQIDILVILSAV